MLALAVAGAGLARKFRVLVRGDYFEPLNLMVCVLLGVADRKSAALKRVMAPVFDYERDAAGRRAMEIAARTAERQMLEAAYRAAQERARAAPAGSPEQRRFHDEAARAMLERDGIAVPRPTCVWTEDATPESLVRLLGEQDGRLLVASAEGTAFAIARGRYARGGGANFDVWLKGHAGDPIRVDRQGQPTLTVYEPALSAAIAMQPDVARQAAEMSELRALGFMARWLWAVPVSRVGSRPAAPCGAPAAVIEDYHRRMTALWESRAPRKGQPNWLRFSAEADQALQGLAQRIEPRLAEGADLADIADWCGKLPGAAARVAGALHAAALISAGGTLAGSEVGGATATDAVELAEKYLLPHAQAAFNGALGANQRVRDAQAVLRWLRDNCANTAKAAKGGGGPPAQQAGDLRGVQGPLAHRGAAGQSAGVAGGPPLSPAHPPPRPARAGPQPESGVLRQPPRPGPRREGGVATSFALFAVFAQSVRPCGPGEGRRHSANSANCARGWDPLPRHRGLAP
jgi:hypothetical protein